MCRAPYVLKVCERHLAQLQQILSPITGNSPELITEIPRL
jgi:hypothetical protein